MQLFVISMVKMSSSQDFCDWHTEVRQVPWCHAVQTLVKIDTQSLFDAVSDIRPMKILASDIHCYCQWMSSVLSLWQCHCLCDNVTVLPSFVMTDLTWWTRSLSATATWITCKSHWSNCHVLVMTWLGTLELVCCCLWWPAGRQTVAVVDSCGDWLVIERMVKWRSCRSWKKYLPLRAETCLSNDRSDVMSTPRMQSLSATAMWSPPRVSEIPRLSSLYRFFLMLIQMSSVLCLWQCHCAAK